MNTPLDNRNAKEAATSKRERLQIWDFGVSGSGFRFQG